MQQQSVFGVCTHTEIPYLWKCVSFFFPLWAGLRVSLHPQEAIDVIWNNYTYLLWLNATTWLLFFEDPIIYVIFQKPWSGIEFPIICLILQRTATNELLSNSGSTLMKTILIGKWIVPQAFLAVFWTYILYYAHGSEPLDHFPPPSSVVFLIFLFHSSFLQVSKNFHSFLDLWLSPRFLPKC